MECIRCTHGRRPQASGLFPVAVAVGPYLVVMERILLALNQDHWLPPLARQQLTRSTKPENPLAGKWSSNGRHVRPSPGAICTRLGCGLAVSPSTRAFESPCLRLGSTGPEAEQPRGGFHGPLHAPSSLCLSKEAARRK